jgi:hypothetical protein
MKKNYISYYKFFYVNQFLYDFKKKLIYDFECSRCKVNRENKTFRKKIFTDENNNEYCKIDLDDSMGKDYYEIYSNKK